MDASVWVSRLLPRDAHHDLSRNWLERHFAAQGLVVAPMLFLAEVAGAISRQTGEPDLAQRAVDTLVRLPGLRLVAVDQRLGREAGRLAAGLGLRGADAVYVATAVILRLPLVTWDTEQRERGGAVITVHTPSRALG